MLSFSRDWTPEHDGMGSPEPSRPKPKSESKAFKENHKVKDNSSKYKQKKIKGDNCCSRFLYNLPPGMMLFFLPGFIFLVIGIAMIFYTRQTESTDLSQTGVIFSAIGAVMCFCGLIACGTARCKVTEATKGLLWSSTGNEVKLVSIHRLPSVSASQVNFRLESTRQYENQAYVT